MTKFCKDCKHFSTKRGLSVDNFWNDVFIGVCLKTVKYNVVTGTPTYYTCATQRTIRGCGERARYLNQKNQVLPSQS